MCSWQQLDGFLQVWERVQVELHGRYSLERLREFAAHRTSSSRLKNLAWLLLTPLPALAIILVFDALPLKSPHIALPHQTVWLYIRLSLFSMLVTLMFVHQIHNSSPTLPLPMRWLWSVALVATAVAVTIFYGLGVFWVFPTPFSPQLVGGPWIAIVVCLVWWLWKPILAADATAKAKLQCYLKTLAVQNTMMVGYLAYYAVFILAGERYQVYVSLVLPFMKLFFKNSARSGLFFMEDSAPAIITFNIDVFHAMFVCTVTQQVRQLSPMGVVMLVDLVQALIACHEINSVISRIYVAAGKTPHAMELASSLENRDLLQCALTLVDTSSYVREHPSIALPQHLQLDYHHRRSQMKMSKIHLWASSWAIHVAPREIVAIQPASDKIALSEPHQSGVECVQLVLRLLHMVDFYVLNEFVEVAVAAVYTLYVQAMTRIPNRIYYQQFNKISDDELQGTVENLGIYAFLEMLSFVAFCITVNRRLGRFSTVQQLAFCFEKHWAVVIPTFTVWVFVIVQFSFEHFGIDFTFQFKWVHNKPNSV